MASTKKKRQIVRIGSGDKKVTCDAGGTQKGTNGNVEDMNRLLTLEEISEARQKNLEKFKEVARLYGFVMEME